MASGTNFNDPLKVVSAGSVSQVTGVLAYGCEMMGVCIFQRNGSGDAVAAGWGQPAIQNDPNDPTTRHFTVPTKPFGGAGEFASGPAFAVAIAVVNDEDDGLKKVIQWSQLVTLQDA